MSSSSPPDAREHRQRDETHGSPGRAGRLVASWRETYLSPTPEPRARANWARAPVRPRDARLLASPHRCAGLRVR